MFVKHLDVSVGGAVAVPELPEAADAVIVDSLGMLHSFIA